MILLPENLKWPKGLPRTPMPAEASALRPLRLHGALTYGYFNMMLRLASFGHDPRTTQTFRTAEYQLELWNKGRTTPGPIVTYARPGTSAHEYINEGRPAAMAFDIAPIINAQIHWPTDALSAPFWSDVRDSAKMLGLLWGGNFKSPPGDYGHIQHPNFTGMQK